jgi:hypothetical protein
MIGFKIRKAMKIKARKNSEGSETSKGLRKFGNALLKLDPIIKSSIIMSAIKETNNKRKIKYIFIVSPSALMFLFFHNSFFLYWMSEGC